MVLSDALPRFQILFLIGIINYHFHSTAIKWKKARAVKKLRGQRDGEGGYRNDHNFRHGAGGSKGPVYVDKKFSMLFFRYAS